MTKKDVDEVMGVVTASIHPDTYEPVVMAYAVQPYTCPWDTTPTSEKINEWVLDLDKKRTMKTPAEIEKLLDNILDWLSDLGEYPEDIAEIVGEDVMEDVDSEDEDIRSRVIERAAVRILRWVLGKE